jgi:hypothetical protein
LRSPSDVAGMIFFPLLLPTLAWAVVPPARRGDARFDRLLLVACVSTAILFAATKTIGVANDAYRVTWGVLQWPLHALRALTHGRELPGITRVTAVRDPTDLLAVPFVALAWYAGRRGRGSCVSRLADEHPAAATGITVRHYRAGHD